MRRWFILFLVTIGSLFFWPATAGCAKGAEEAPPLRSRTSPMSADLGTRVPSTSDMPGVTDTGTRIQDAGTRTPEVREAGSTRIAMRESCNGVDDDLDGQTDEDFLCPLGRMGEICVTTCGVNGYRLCEAPSCSWSTVCHTFDEICGDTLDNDCNGLVDDGCESNPVETRVCDEAMIRIHLEPDPTSLGPCDVGWTLILWGAGGAFEPYLSTPGNPLDVTIRADWLGWAAFTAYCGDWSGVRRWDSFEGRPSSDAGISVTLDGNPIPVQVCYDPGGDIIRPLIPVQCGLPACPGPSY